MRKTLLLTQHVCIFLPAQALLACNEYFFHLYLIKRFANLRHKGQKNNIEYGNSCTSTPPAPNKVCTKAPQVDNGTKMEAPAACSNFHATCFEKKLHEGCTPSCILPAEKMDGSRI